MLINNQRKHLIEALIQFINYRTSRKVLGHNSVGTLLFLLLYIFSFAKSFILILDTFVWIYKIKKQHQTRSKANRKS